MTNVTNKKNEKGSLSDVLKNKDVFIGVSAANLVTSEMISTMNEKSIVFAMANPTPEIMPDEAKKGGAFIIGTGRSDFPNQVNNVLAFPGIFRGALDVRASDINNEMKKAAVFAIANTLEDKELSETNVIPKAFDPRVGKNVADAVADAARKSGVARV
jgi:malate dehydrogenase (oxaloacetate-decarboxylating)